MGPGRVRQGRSCAARRRSDDDARSTDPGGVDQCCPRGVRGAWFPRRAHSDIAKRAGTSYGVFYHYFDSKESVLDELFTSVTGDMYNASQARSKSDGDVVDKIRASNRQYLVVAARNAQPIAMIEELAYRDPQFRELKLRIREPFLLRNEAGIRRLQEQGLADPNLDASMAASMLGGMIEHFTLLWFFHGVPTTRSWLWRP